MSWTDDQMVAAFDSEVGTDLAALATADQKIQWWNEGQARLLRRKALVDDITWAAADLDVDLPTDFIQLDKIVVDDGVMVEPWRVFGNQLVLDDPTGANGAGTARLFYWGEWPAMTSSVASELNNSQDFACLSYALHRFYKRLCSNRFYYKRYSTLVGQNAATTNDLQQEAAQYYQDFLDARDDLEPEPPAYFYSE